MARFVTCTATSCGRVPPRRAATSGRKPPDAAAVGRVGVEQDNSISIPLSSFFCCSLSPQFFSCDFFTSFSLCRSQLLGLIGVPGRRSVRIDLAADYRRRRESPAHNFRRLHSMPLARSPLQNIITSSINVVQRGNCLRGRNNTMELHRNRHRTLFNTIFALQFLKIKSKGTVIKSSLIRL